MKLTKLTDNQTARKSELEAIIRNEIAAFKRCGEALAEIRNSKLYLDEFDTFEEYLEEKWCMSQARGYQLMDASEAAKRVLPLVELPNERAARPLTKLPPKLQVKAAKIIAKTPGPVTAKKVEEAVAKVAPRGGLYATKVSVGETETPVHATNEAKPGTNAHVVETIEAWYAKERTHLTQYPAANPDRMVKLILDLFR